MELQPKFIFVGILFFLYTVIGGIKAVSYTQKYQMYVILIGLVVSFYFLNSYIFDQITFSKSFEIIKMFNKNNAISFSFDPKEKYTLWTGLLGGFFLSLSYFGTDQSQVSRYINAKDQNESRIGLIFNAILKIPFQFLILCSRRVAVVDTHLLNRSGTPSNHVRIQCLLGIQSAER